MTGSEYAVLARCLNKCRRECHDQEIYIVDRIINRMVSELHLENLYLDREAFIDKCFTEEDLPGAD